MSKNNNKTGSQNGVTKVVVVGGGTAGWLSAAIIAAKHKPMTNNLSESSNSTVEVTLVESPDVKNLGVGEGTWPTMRDTLRNIGISEREFLSCCDASFKQASKFVSWSSDNSHYYHPFTPPAGFGVLNLAEYWLQASEESSFEEYVGAQGSICERHLAPKTPQMRDYAFSLNYGYHLNAGKFVAMLHQHCVEKLGVNYVQAHVHEVQNDNEGYILTLKVDNEQGIQGDFFIDCSGFAGVLIGKHFGVEFESKSDILFNDTALALQVEHADENVPISSSTVATAQTNGWIWDIALQNRRGIGHVYSSEFGNEQQAEERLAAYVNNDPYLAKIDVQARKINFKPGYRKTFWYRNCVAIGVSAGFVEPLEATALVLIEKSAQWVAEQLPRTREAMQVLAKRFNRLTHERWLEIIDFLKLHYVLSDRRDSEYWRMHKSENTIPESLKEALSLWKTQSPWLYENTQKFELFSSASKQYVLYGMGFSPSENIYGSSIQSDALLSRFRNETYLAQEKLLKGLPTNRAYLKSL